jgi:hypothetical protein
VPTPLLSAAEFLDRCDARNVGDLVLDDGTRADAGDLTGGASAAGRRVQAAIDAAIGQLLSAANVGKRYTQQQLEDLTDGSYFAARIKSILRDLAYGELLRRRNLPADDFDRLCPGYAMAQADLELIRTGERVFGDVPGVPEAGLPHAIDTATRPGIDPPLLSDNVRVFGVLNPSCRPGWQPGQCW